MNHLMKHFLNQRVIATTELSESVVSDIETFLIDQKVFIVALATMPNRFVLSILSKAKLLNRIPDQMP